jgi:hypothetical protein
MQLTYMRAFAPWPWRSCPGDGQPGSYELVRRISTDKRACVYRFPFTRLIIPVIGQKRGSAKFGQDRQPFGRIILAFRTRLHQSASVLRIAPL